jgi:Flp pilus assembly protein TadG
MRLHVSDIGCGFDRRRDPRGQRGAMLVHVATALVGLLGFSALTIDLGVLWVARRQAQNAADAGALSAAASLAFGDPGDTAAVTAAARSVAEAHEVWGQAPTAAGAVDVTFPGCPTGAPAAGGGCARVDVNRTEATGGALPVQIAVLFGGAPMAVRATATAKALDGNATNCRRPWAIPDRWTESDGNDLFNLGSDVYTAPTSSDPGTSYVWPQEGTAISVQWVELPPFPLPRHVFFSTQVDGLDEDAYLDAIEGCSESVGRIGDVVLNYPFHPDATAASVDALIDLDPDAYWDSSSGTVRGSRFPASPRIVPVALFDPADYSAPTTIRLRSGTPLRVTNVVGLFLTPMTGSAVLNGVIVRLAGSYDASAPTVHTDASFLKAVSLVR